MGVNGGEVSRLIGSQLFSAFQQEGGEGGVGIDWFTGGGRGGQGGIKIDITVT